MFVIGTTAGWWAQSTALMADALDMLADASAYGLGLMAVTRGVNFRRTSTRWSGSLLLILGVGILAEVGHRALAGSQPQPTVMMAFSLLSLAVNVTVLRLLAPFRTGEVHPSSHLDLHPGRRDRQCWRPGCRGRDHDDRVGGRRPCRGLSDRRLCHQGGGRNPQGIERGAGVDLVSLLIFHRARPPHRSGRNVALEKPRQSIGSLLARSKVHRCSAEEVRRADVQQRLSGNGRCRQAEAHL